MNRDKLSPKVTDVYYSDFLIDLNPHPIVKDIVKYTNEYAVTSAIKNLLLVNKGERLYQPTIGGDIKRMLFEPVSSATSEMMSAAIQQTIIAHEPRAKVYSVDVVADEDRQLYTVTITFYIINNPDPVSVDLSLSRSR